MNRRETRESVNRGCNCLIISVLVLGFVISCAKSLINGDIKLPRLGSSHVRGGSGNYGTSNGYNVRYKQTTSPNYNSSLSDYTYTDYQPTEYREGKSSQHINSNSSSTHNGTNSSNSVLNSSSSSSGTYNTSNSNMQKKSRTYYKLCPACKGNGKKISYYYFNNFGSSLICGKCSSADPHGHEELITCELCSGKGQIYIGPLGETELTH